jgi:hypothetical protein
MVIQIDVHPAEKNLIHMTHMLLAPVHICHLYASCGQSMYVTTFHADPTELDRFTAPDSTSQLSWVARETRISFAPNTTIEEVLLSQVSIDKHVTSVYWVHIFSMWSVLSILARGGQPISP